MPKARSTSKPAWLPIIHRFAAGIDIGSRFHIAAVSPDLCDEPVQTFRAFTSDLERMADWLVATGTKTVVMESTGVYWVAAYEVLESRGLRSFWPMLAKRAPSPAERATSTTRNGCSDCMRVGCYAPVFVLAETLRS